VGGLLFGGEYNLGIIGVQVLSSTCGREKKHLLIKPKYLIIYGKYLATLFFPL
jgi:hypothetical protein